MKIVLASYLFLSAIVFAEVAQAQATRVLPATHAQGENQIVTVELYPGHGTTLNFRPTGETIRRAWLDDPSRVVLDFDDTGCAAVGEQGGGECAATVIHLRRIQPLNFPNLPATPTTSLTVLTDENLYKFRLTYATGEPSYYTLEIQPDRVQSGITPLTGKPIQLARLIEQGRSIAQARSLIAEGDDLWNRLQILLDLIRRGEQVESAAERAGVSQNLVARLVEMGQETRFPDVEATMSSQI